MAGPYGPGVHRRAGGPGAVRRAVAAAMTAPAPHHTTPWRFVLRRGEAARSGCSTRCATPGRRTCAVTGSPGVRWQAVRRGDVLRRAPYLVVPAWSWTAHTTTRRAAVGAEREMFLVAMGAGVQNLFVALAVEGLGSAWVSSTMFCADVVRGAPWTCRRTGTRWAPSGSATRRAPARPPAPRPRRLHRGALAQGGDPRERPWGGSAPHGLGRLSPSSFSAPHAGGRARGRSRRRWAGSGLLRPWRGRPSRVRAGTSPYVVVRCAAGGRRGAAISSSVRRSS